VTIDSIAIGVLGTGAAALVGLWPKLAPYLKRLPSPAPAPAPARPGVTYQAAMVALASVRARLVETGGVSDEAGKAIEAITHALVQGSDQ
jgi:hypothetical protein